MSGNLTRDPETRDVGETTVTRFSVALNSRYKTKEGELKETVTYVDVDAWNGLGKTVEQYLKKGSKVIVAGSLKQDVWEDQEGNKKSKLYVVADQVEFADSKPEGKPQASSPAPSATKTSSVGAKPRGRPAGRPAAKPAAEPVAAGDFENLDAVDLDNVSL